MVKHLILAMPVPYRLLLLFICGLHPNNQYSIYRP